MYLTRDHDIIFQSTVKAGSCFYDNFEHSSDHLDDPLSSLYFNAFSWMDSLLSKDCVLSIEYAKAQVKQNLPRDVKPT